LAHWAIRQFTGLRAQVDATDDAARQELASILDRLQPIPSMPNATGQRFDAWHSPGPQS
jgi:hypothetical protein